MKKWLIVILAGSSLLLFSGNASAKETLLDNNFDLKTGRLNKEQGANNKVQSFITEDCLFDSEMMAKAEHAKRIKEKKNEQEQSKYFLMEVTAVKEIDTGSLFAEGKTVKVAQSDETAAAVSSPSFSFWPLIVGAALLTGVALSLFHPRRKKRVV